MHGSGVWTRYNLLGRGKVNNNAISDSSFLFGDTSTLFVSAKFFSLLGKKKGTAK